MLTASIDIPADAVLGAVFERLDPMTVLAAVRDQATGVDASAQADWGHCRMIEAIYHPGRHVQAAFALLADESIPRRRYWPEGQIVYVRAPLRRPMSRRGFELRLGGQSVECYLFPNDRRLRQVRCFAGSSDAPPVWQAWLDASGDDFRLDAPTLRRRLIRYVPEQKWIIRLRCRGIEAESGQGGMRAIAVRCSSPRSCEALQNRHRFVAEHLGGVHTAARAPRIVGVDAARGLLATRWMGGDSVVDALACEPAEDVFGRVCDALAQFHAMPADGFEPLTPDRVNQRVREAVDDLRIACPQMRDELEAVQVAFQRRLAAWRPADTVTLHNDFHWNQLRLRENRVAVLDFERMCAGDPLIDVANFAVQIRMLGQREDVDVSSETAQSWSACFLDVWSHRTGMPVDTGRFACPAVLSMMELARGMMRHLRPGWRELTKHCVEAATIALDSTSPEAAVA